MGEGMGRKWERRAFAVWSVHVRCVVVGWGMWWRRRCLRGCRGVSWVGEFYSSDPTTAVLALSCLAGRVVGISSGR